MQVLKSAKASWVLGLCALLALAPQSVRAKEAEEEWAKEGRNEIGPYLGFASAGGDHGLSVGLDYERRLTRRFGIGAVLEYTSGDFREGLAAVSFDWHPWKELKLFVAPGIEVDREDGTNGALLRLGAEYGLAIAERMEIAPGVAVDFSDENTTVVIGAVLAWKF